MQYPSLLSLQLWQKNKYIDLLSNDGGWSRGRQKGIVIFAIRDWQCLIDVRSVIRYYKFNVISFGILKLTCSQDFPLMFASSQCMHEKFCLGKKPDLSLLPPKAPMKSELFMQNFEFEVDTSLLQSRSKIGLELCPL